MFFRSRAQVLPLLLSNRLDSFDEQLVVDAFPRFQPHLHIISVTLDPRNLLDELLKGFPNRRAMETNGNVGKVVAFLRVRPLRLILCLAAERAPGQVSRHAECAGQVGVWSLYAELSIAGLTCGWRGCSHTFRP